MYTILICHLLKSKYKWFDLWKPHPYHHGGKLKTIFSIREQEVYKVSWNFPDLLRCSKQTLKYTKRRTLHNPFLICCTAPMYNITKDINLQSKPSEYETAQKAFLSVSLHSKAMQIVWYNIVCQALLYKKKVKLCFFAIRLHTKDRHAARTYLQKNGKKIIVVLIFIKQLTKWAWKWKKNVRLIWLRKTFTQTGSMENMLQPSWHRLHYDTQGSFLCAPYHAAYP